MNEKIRKFYDNLNNEIIKYGHYITLDKDIALNIIDQAITKIAKLNYLDFCLEFVPNNQIKISLKFEKEILIMINIPLDLSYDWILVSCFKDKKSVAHYCTDFDEFIERIEENI